MDPSNLELDSQTAKTSVVPVSMCLTTAVPHANSKFFLVNLVAMTVSSLNLPQKFLKQNAPSVYMYSESPSKQTAVVKYSVKHVLNQFKHAQCVTTQISPPFMTRSYSDLSMNCKFDVHTRKEAAPGQENWENLRTISTVTISPVAASLFISNVSLTLLAARLKCLAKTW